MFTRIVRLASLSLSIVALGALSGCSSTAGSSDDDEQTEDALSDFECNSANVVKEKKEPLLAQVVATRAAVHDGYDRFVMEFGRGIPVPSYEVRRQAKPAFYGPGDDAVTLAGRRGLSIRVYPAAGFNIDTGTPVFHGPTRFKPTGTKVMLEAGLSEDFEGQVSWGLGLARSSCYRVFELSNPPRLVVDVKNTDDPELPDPPATTEPEFECNKVEVRDDRETMRTAPVVAVRAAGHPEYDRFVMEFAKSCPLCFSEGPPGYSVKKQSTAAFQGPGDQPIQAEGQAGLRVSVHPTTDRTSSPDRFKPADTTVMREAVEFDNFEGYVGWGLGLSRASCFRAFKLTNPPRLVVDVKK